MDNTLSKQIFIKGMKILSQLPQGKNPVDLNDDFSIEVWYGALNDLTDEQFQKAVIYILRNSKWHPSPVDIRKAAGFSLETEKGSVSLAESQWEIFRTAFGHIGYRAMSEKWLDGGQVFDDGITDAVAKTMAKDFAMASIDEAGNWRSRFIKAYDNMKEFGKKTNEVMKIGNLISLSQHKQSELDTKTAPQACKK